MGDGEKNSDAAERHKHRGAKVSDPAGEEETHGGVAEVRGIEQEISVGKEIQSMVWP